MRTILTFPEKSRDTNSVLQSMEQIRQNDQEWKTGKMFGFVFNPGDEPAKLIEEAFMKFAHINRLSPTSFPSLRRFENEIVSMCANLLHGDENVVGSVTSGGTESIIMTVLVAREMDKNKGRRGYHPELVMPTTAHPAFLKACHYMNITPRIIPVREDKRVDVNLFREAINKNTILLVCSAPCFPFGVIDPVSDIARIAVEQKKLFHVDACMGGFMLPFMKETGYPVPDFDFSVPGVTSVSLDAHKFGYAMKGASIILYRNPEMRMKQFYIYPDWPGGIFASVALMGTRSGGSVAGAWALINYLGKEGYREIVKQVMETTKKIISGINSIPGLNVISNPDMSLISFTCENHDIFIIADMMEEKGWHLDRQQFPDSLHLTISRGNVETVDQFINDLKEVMSQTEKLQSEGKTNKFTVRAAKVASRILPGKTIGKLAARLSGKENNTEGSYKPPRQAAMYGITGSLKSRHKVSEAIAEMLDGLYRL
jgi:glutamate/tyrosine decarboxylase-like PLP-dependent enzyme